MIPIFCGFALNVTAISFYRPSQSMLAGATGERIAEGELHPGAQGSEPQYLKNLRVEAEHDSHVFATLMLASSSAMFFATLVGIASLNRKVRVPAVRAISPADR